MDLTGTLSPTGQESVVVSLLTLQGFLSQEDCLAVRRGMDAGMMEEAEVLDHGIHRQSGVRNARLVEPAAAVIDRMEARIESCRDRAATAFALALGDREGAGFIRYPPGGFYRAHRDRGDDAQWEGARRRAVAVVIFLNTSRDVSVAGEFEGGVLRLFFPDGDIELVPEAGLLVAFRAEVLHEVTEVRGGTRDTVVDWFYSTGR